MHREETVIDIFHMWDDDSFCNYLIVEITRKLGAHLSRNTELCILKFCSGYPLKIKLSCYMFHVRFDD